MIDHIMISRSNGKYPLHDPTYKAEQAILGYQDSGPEDSQRLAVIFPSWHAHEGDAAFRALTGRLGKHGFAVRQYDFSDNILEPNVERVLESFHNIQDTVVNGLEQLVSSREFEEVHFISASLGAVSLALVASKFPQMSSATIVTGSSNLALGVWHGSRTVRVREALEAAGLDEKALDKAWQELAPKNHAEAFKNKSVRVILSTTDLVIPTIYQRELAEALDNAGSQVHVATTRMGHYAAIGSYCYLDRKLP